jgi:hypothetical protein
MNTIDIILCRVHKSDRTVGMLFNTNGLALKTVELPWKDNKPNVSCIPDGIYPYITDFSPNKGRDVLELRDVPNRSQIQIHAATKPEHVLGCIGCGTRSQEDKFFKSVPDRGFIHIKTIEI